MSAGAYKALGHGPEAGVKPLSGTYERRRNTPPTVDMTVASVSEPPLHAISTTKPPLARSPFTSPSLHADGSAGNKCTAPS